MAIPINQHPSVEEVPGYAHTDRVGQYAAALRDRHIEQSGKAVVFTIPVNAEGFADAEYDFNGDPIDQTTIGVDAVHLETKIIPKYESYYNLLDVLGSESVNDTPLEAMVKSTDEIPQGSQVELDVNFSGSVGVKSILFEVLNGTAKHIDSVYSRTILLVPKRGVRDDDPLDDPESGV